jgi:hypothetical protein
MFNQQTTYNQTTYKTAQVMETTSSAVWHNITPGDSYDIRKYIKYYTDP